MLNYKCLIRGKSTEIHMQQLKGDLKMSKFELMNIVELQRLQDGFCAVTNVAACCLDTDGEFVSELSGDEKIRHNVKDFLRCDRMKELLSRVEEGSLEDVAIEEIAELQTMVAIVAVRVKDQTLFYWVVFAGKGTREEENFYRVLDVLRDTSNIMFDNRMSCFSAEAENHKYRSEQQALNRDMQTVEATTAVVQLLDSDESEERLLDKWLRIIAEHTQVDTAQIFHVYPQTKKMNVVSQWAAQGVVPFFDKTRNIESFNFLNVTKPLVLSTESEWGEYGPVAEELGVEAIMVFPIEQHNDGGCLVLSLNHRKCYNWTMEEVKFVSDAIKVMQSILTKRLQQDTLSGSHAAMEAILENVGCAVYVLDKESREMLFANRKLKNTFEKELRDGSFRELIQKGVVEEQDTGCIEFFHEDKACWYDFDCKDITWIDGSPATLFSLYEITDKKVYQKKIEQQAHTDFLTGLYNRMCCERDLARQIDETKKNGGEGAILYLDLDDFKHINDGLGHQYGDALLKSIAIELRSVKGIKNTCYRMGGDEFVVMIPPRVYPELERIVDEIRQIFVKPWYLKDADYYCTASMGIVTFPDAGDSVEVLIRKADIAMYEAKKDGKNRLSRYVEGNDSFSGRRLSMEKNMRNAAADGFKEFEIYYQPIINVELGGKQCAGAEALIRWNSQELGFIKPAEFIPLAEYLGLINPIGNYILLKACKHCKEWNDNGYPYYKVNVNLSVVQLLQSDIVEIVESALKETQVNPANLTLEVTESLAINDMERMKAILHKIKALGVKIALDDFGTGYSSLNHIREIPFDVIKVDQSFVKDLADDTYSQSFIKMIAELGQTIGVSICVEGVETKEQLEAIQDMKVKYIQGFYFDRPMQRKKFQAKYVNKGIAKKEETM